MFNYVLLGISLCLGVGKHLISKAGKKEFSGVDRLMSANLITALLALAVFAVGGLDLLRMKDSLLLLLALLYGLLTMGCQSLYILAVRNGSVSVCSLIYSSCFLIPTVFSAVAYENGISLIKLLGIGVMLVSILLVSYQKREGEKGMDLFSLIMALLAMCSAGSVGILQKLYAHEYGGEGMSEYLFASFAFMLFFSLLTKGILRIVAGGKREQETRICTREIPRVFLLCAALLAVCVVSTNKLNLFLIGALPGVWFFPVINGGTVMLSAIFSRILFGERLTPLRLGGLLMGLLAMVLIAL